MKEAARLLQFELAAQLRDEIQRLERGEDPTAADTSAVSYTHLKAITEKEIEEASVKVMMGPEKKSHVVTDEERRLTAYHETGHAITGYFSKHHDPVHQISIISRGGAGGYTMYLPEKDPSYITKTAMFENIVTLLGGRVAEQLVLEDISTGASSCL